jgi:hypothetical protein
MSQKVFYFGVEDKKLVNRFFNIFRFSLFIREICGSKHWVNSDFRENVSYQQESGTSVVWRSLRDLIWTRIIHSFIFGIYIPALMVLNVTQMTQNTIIFLGIL